MSEQLRGWKGVERVVEYGDGLVCVRTVHGEVVVWSVEAIVGEAGQCITTAREMVCGCAAALSGDVVSVCVDR